MSVNRPAWSYTEGKSDKNKKPSVQSGLRSVGGAKSWCFQCGGEHPYGQPCLVRGAPRVVTASPPDAVTQTVPCGLCSSPVIPSPFNRTGFHYCGDRCRRSAKSSREWARQKAAREEKVG